MIDALFLTFIFLVAGVVSVPIATRLGLGSVLGYLLAGVLISPLLSLLQVDITALQHFAELGVVLMLFLVGLELKPQALWAMRARLVGLGGGQVALTALVVTAVCLGFGESWNTGLAIGLILALSSTAIVIQTLSEKGLLKSDGGQSSFAVLLAQDIIVIPMLAFMPLLASPDLSNIVTEVADTAGSHDSTLLHGLSGWQTTAVTLGAIALVIVGGHYLASPIFRYISIANLREMFTATALLFVVSVTVLMSLVGLSPALGTFLAGVVLASSPYRHELESDIAPFKGLLLGLFFMTVGAGIDFQLLFEKFWLIIALSLGLMIVKAIVLLVLGRLFNIRGSNKWLFGLSLAQAGEFGFVLIAFSESNSVLSQATADILLLIVAISMLLTPLLFILYDKKIAPRYVNDSTGQHSSEFPNDKKIIIAGSGRMGSVVDRMLRLANYDATVIDFSVKRLRALERFGVQNYFGDATRPDILHAAGIEEADILIIAIDDPEQVTKLVKHVVEHYPKLHVIARAHDNNHVYDLWSYGCRDIIRETWDSSLRMGRSTFEALGIPTEQAQQMVDTFNHYDKDSMVAVADAHQTGVPSHENQAYIARIKEHLKERDPEVRATMNALRHGKDSQT
ncbi:cation:proton antiporter [Rhodanobacter aciditrophus]|uniref:Cation:proton antiporter n=1 Tax=Rhodanobacter aciditrophus TaxID=1623218 RepID=A0ABW4B3I3_9GAMM